MPACGPASGCPLALPLAEDGFDLPSEEDREPLRGGPVRDLGTPLLSALRSWVLQNRKAVVLVSAPLVLVALAALASASAARGGGAAAASAPHGLAAGAVRLDEAAAAPTAPPAAQATTAPAAAGALPAAPPPPGQTTPPTTPPATPPPATPATTPPAAPAAPPPAEAAPAAPAAPGQVDPAAAAAEAAKKAHEDALKSNCTGPGGDCRATRCCWKDGDQCFQKNEDFAGCMDKCAAGVHSGDTDAKPWTCAKLDPITGPKPGPECVPTGVDCSKARCCADPSLKCFEKNQWWGMCMVQCIPGVHEGDKPPEPWSCKELNKQNGETTTSTPPPGPIGPVPEIQCDGSPNMPEIPVSDPGGATAFIKVLSYNLFWWNLYGIRKGNGDSASHLLADNNRPEPFDLMGFQECEGGGQVIGAAGLAGDFEIFQFNPLLKTTALCMAYRKSAFALLAQGQDWVAEDQQSQYFGKRAVQWMRLHHLASNRNVFFMNHHGPLVVDSGGKCGGAVTAFHILRAIAGNARPGDAVVLLGDFNANTGSATMSTLLQRLKMFYPAGLDNILANLDPSALVRNADLGNGGSDHDARMAIIRLGPPGGAPPPAGGPPPPPGPAYPPPAPGIPFDCVAGFANWAAEWAPEKKNWCCKELGKGCPAR